MEVEILEGDNLRAWISFRICWNETM